MDHDRLNKITQEVIDQHPDKFLYLYEKPEFICWFIGRIDDLCEQKIDKEIIRNVIMEML